MDNELCKVAVPDSEWWPSFVDALRRIGLPKGHPAVRAAREEIEAGWETTFTLLEEIR